MHQEKMGHTLTKFLLEHGKRFDSVRLAPQRGTPRECFKNAAVLAIANPEYLYCEGLAASAHLPFSFPHAWLMDAEGRALEVTWDAPGQLYLGLVMTTKFLHEQLAATRVWGFLEGRLPPWFFSEPQRWSALPPS